MLSLTAATSCWAARKPALISGDRELVAKIRANPLFRALARRQDVSRRAGSDAARLFARGLRLDSGAAHDAATRRRDSLHRAGQLAERLREECPELAWSKSPSRARCIGGGSAPAATLPTHVLAIKSERIGADALLRTPAPMGDADHRPRGKGLRAARPAHRRTANRRRQSSPRLKRICE